MYVDWLYSTFSKVSFLGKETKILNEKGVYAV